MTKIYSILISLVIFLIPVGSGAHAQTEETQQKDTFFTAKVLEVIEQGEIETGGITFNSQKLKIKILSQPEKDKEVLIENVAEKNWPGYKWLEKGDKIVVVKSSIAGEVSYFFMDEYRLPSVILIFIIFLVLAGIFARGRGLGAVAGLVVSVIILVAFAIPQIAAGRSPLLVGLIAAFTIAVLSIYTAHGIHKRTTIALVSTILTLIVASLLAVLFVNFAKLMGLGTDEALSLRYGLNIANFKGLLLAGIIIGVLGVLDDITTAQTAAIEELKKVNPALTARELYQSGVNIGREHIVSLVNTLALAYIGAALPLFLILSRSDTQPWWIMANSELLSEEIIRTLVGSVALILAVPITTSIAAYYYGRKPNVPNAV